MLKAWIARHVPQRWITYQKFLRAPERYLVLKKSELTYATDNLFTKNNADFLVDPRFAAAYRQAETLGGGIMPPSGMQWRIYVLCWAAEQAAKLPGDFVACGVYTGFCDRAIMEYLNFSRLQKNYYLMDTFSGLDARYSSEAELRAQERYKEGNRDLYKEARQNFPQPYVRIVKGPIPDTLPQAGTGPVCFLTIDMNAVQPEVAALEYFWEKLVPGGLIVLDDYGYPSHEAQKRAHDAFARQKGVSILTLPTCQGLLIKPY